MAAQMLTGEEIAERYRLIQDDICFNLQQYDGKGIFREDHWKRPGGGGGRSRVMENANMIEKGGVNFSAVEGRLPEKISSALGLEPCDFFATGVSIVLHPSNPWVPIIHMNIRFFQMKPGPWWFGGGIDLTPHYVNPEYAQRFHQHLKKVCDDFQQTAYDEYKAWADRYFHIKHRSESRGVGGIFFDRLGESNIDDAEMQQKIFDFTCALGNSFYPIYEEQLEAFKDKPYGQKERSWQLHRRGRYVEFNLVYDRGTKFGLETQGRIESILMSLPPDVKWTYDHKPSEDELAQKTLDYLSEDRDWINWK
jgi:coproporphyrinogen III oxidase